MAGGGIPTPGEVYGVPHGQVANGVAVPEYRKQLIEQGVGHPTSAGYAALSNMFGQIAHTADGLSDRLTALYARNVQQQSSEAAQQDVANAHDMADIHLPAGSSLSEEAYRRSAIVAGQSRLQVAAVQDVDALAQTYAGDPEAFQKALEDKRNAAASELDPRFTPVVHDLYNHLGTSAWREIAGNVRQAHVDQDRADLGASLSVMTSKAANLARSGDIQGAMGLIDELTKSLNKAGPVAGGGAGVVSYTQQGELVRGITEQVGKQYVLGWVTRNPQAADTALHGGSTFAAALGQSENSGRYDTPNPVGKYVGKYQFGEERLTQLGFYQPVAGENLKANKWEGQFTGLPDVHNVQDFLKSPQAQEQAYQAHIQNIDSRMDADNLLARYGGQVIGGVPVTRDAIRAMAHLGGYQGAKQFLESGGRDNPNDGRTSLSDYGKQFAHLDQGREGLQQAGLDPTGDPKVDVILQNLPPDRRDEVIRTAELQLRSIRAETAAQQQATMVQDRVLLGQRAEDQFAMLATGQQPNEALTFADVQKAYPDSFQAEQQWNEIQRKTAFAQNYGEVSKLTLPQQEALLATRVPDPNSPRFAEQQKDYEGLQKAIIQNRQDLAKDPAGELRRTDPATRSAWDGVSAGTMPIAQAMRVTVAAQAARGLTPEQIKPLPAAAAAGVVQQFMTAPTTDEAMAAITPLTAGLGDPAMAQATLQQLTDAKLPSGVGIALERLRDGDENAARQIVSALRVKPGEMPNMGDVTLQKVNKAVDGSYSNLGISAVTAVAAQITGQPGYQDRTAEERKLLQRLAQLDASRGTDPDTAAANAVATVFGKRNSIVEPDDIGAVSMPEKVAPSLLRRGLENLRSNTDLSYLGGGGEAPDFRDKFNTKLSPPEEQKFQQWVAKISQEKGYDAHEDLADYDLRGAWKSGAAGDPRGHLPDTFKKPNHPTFSAESQYSGQGAAAGGSWVETGPGKFDFQASAANLQYRSTDQLRSYFGRAEPNSRLILPPGAEEASVMRRNKMAELQHDIRSGGKFVDRAGGYSLVDPYSGSAIPGPDGRPKVWSLVDVLKAAEGAASPRDVPLGTGIP